MHDRTCTDSFALFKPLYSIGSYLQYILHILLLYCVSSDLLALSQAHTIVVITATIWHNQLNNCITTIRKWLPLPCSITQFMDIYKPNATEGNDSDQKLNPQLEEMLSYLFVTCSSMSHQNVGRWTRVTTSVVSRLLTWWGGNASLYTYIITIYCMSLFSSGNFLKLSTLLYFC